MALVLDGNGDITGLVAGALPSTVIGTGAVLQVVQTSTTTTTVSSSGSWEDAGGFTATITPSQSTSKILVFVSAQYQLYRAAIETVGAFKIVRNSTDIFLESANSVGFEAGMSTNSRIYITARWAAMYLDSPSTTSATTYKLQIKNGATGSSGSITVNNQGNNTQTGTVILMEIAG